jgi:hypothetical protein
MGGRGCPRSIAYWFGFFSLSSILGLVISSSLVLESGATLPHSAFQKWIK